MGNSSGYNQKLLAHWDNNILPKLKEAVRKSKAASRTVGNGQATPAVMIDALAAAGEISEQTKTELYRIRDVRNILAHGGAGHIHVTHELYELVRRYTISLGPLPTLRKLAAKAITVDRSRTLHDALILMRDHDFDVLPYNENGAWRLFTRLHVSRWLEMEFSTAPTRTSFSTEIALDDVLKIAITANPNPPLNQGVLVPNGDTVISTVLDRIRERDHTICLPVALFEDSQRVLHIATEQDLLKHLASVQ